MTTDRACPRRSLVGRCLAWACVLTLLAGVGCAKKATAPAGVGATEKAAPKATAPDTKPAEKSKEPAKEPAKPAPEASAPKARSSSAFTFLTRLILMPAPRRLVGPDEVAVVESRIDDDESYKDKNLTNDEIGNDPDVPTNYRVERIDPDVSVPGPVNPKETVGILNAPKEKAPTTIPPPPGFVGNKEKK